MVVHSCSKSGMKNALGLGERERVGRGGWVSVKRRVRVGVYLFCFLKNAVLGLGLG